MIITIKVRNIATEIVNIIPTRADLYATYYS